MSEQRDANTAEPMLVFCRECFKETEHTEVPPPVSWMFTGYYCKKCDNENARYSDGQYVVWNGREFSHRSLPPFITAPEVDLDA